MLADVLAACVAVGKTTLVTGDEDAVVLAGGLDANVAADPGGGQGPAVAAGLAAAEERPILVINSDLPAATPGDLLDLLDAMPPRGMAIVEARDGRTNALALSTSRLFAPLYGPASARRFRAHAEQRGIELVTAPIANLVGDVDTPRDLARLDGSLGAHTRAALASATAVP